VSDFTRELLRVIALATAVIIAVLGDVAIYRYSKRRPVGKYLTWGEAIAASVFAFFMFNLWYGIIPHQWISLADNEWGWRADRILYGPGAFLKPDSAGGVNPVTISYQSVRDIGVVLIYGIGLTLQVWHWAQWQNRAKPKVQVVPTTTYGRPLARKG
jgi:hypothetical protein